MNNIYITDLDHTFLRSNQTLSDFSIEVWNDKIKSNNIISVATARSFQKTNEFLKKLKINAPMVLLDGAMLIDREKKLIDLKTIPKEIADIVIYESQKFDIYPFIIGLENIKTLEEKFMFCSTLNSHQKDVLQSYKNDPRMQKCEDLRAMDMNLKIVFFGDFRTLNPLNNHLKNLFDNELEFKLSPENYSNGWFLTILHKNADKAHSIVKMLEFLEEDKKNLTVFGDSLNDIGMFKLAKNSIAVSNALDEVKKIASTVLTKSNDEDGVAHYLKEN